MSESGLLKCLIKLPEFRIKWLDGSKIFLTKKNQKLDLVFNFYLFKIVKRLQIKEIFVKAFYDSN